MLFLNRTQRTPLLGMAKLKLSGAAVVLVMVVPLFMYTGALLVGIQLGRALERRPDGVSVSFSIRGAFAYLAKELWDTNMNNIWGPGRRQGSSVAQVVWEPVPAHTNRTTSPRGVMSVGPWGGSGGQPFYMRGPSAPRLHSIILHHSISGIHSLACEYSYPYSLAGAGTGDNRIRLAGPWGRHQSAELHRAAIKLSAGEHVTAVEGTIGRFGGVSDVVITSLTFRSSTGRTYGPYGNTAATGTPFSVPAADGASIVGFWGRSGWLLDAVGVYVKPRSSIVKPGRPATRYPEH
ncbi:jacalin-related lectin 3-like isoform X2 [Panicum virgatum]|nr:jacalin-related lectin 3-like isoform X2 [Panicum virgatum]